MPTFEALPFDIAVVPFPYTDRLTEKRRPALVVSSPELTANTGLVWLLMITSASNQRWPGDVDVPADNRTGLPADSLVRTAKIATVDAEHIIRICGQISPEARAQVSTALQKQMAAVKL